MSPLTHPESIPSGFVNFWKMRAFSKLILADVDSLFAFILPTTPSPGSQPVTDAWLIGFATKHGARLLTFDNRLRSLSDGANVEILRPDA